MEDQRATAMVCFIYTLVVIVLGFSMLSGSQATPAGESGKIVFSAFLEVEGNWEIVVTDEDGQHMVNLSNNPADDYEPAWSPDGKHIAFVSDRDGNDEIYIMDADGSNQRRITNNPSVDIRPSFAPDGRRLLFIRMPAIPGIGDVFLIDIDGQNEKHLTDGSAAEWSPDGKKIAFCKKDPHLGNWDIYLMDADGSNQVNITKHPAGDFDPAWSPDGKQIAFISNRTGLWDIHKMDSDGQNVVCLTQVVAPQQADEPTWSPDGRYIAFYCLNPYQVAVMKANGTDLRVIAAGAHPSWFDPAFARRYMVKPTGKQATRWGWAKWISK